MTNFAILAIGGMTPMVSLCLDSIRHLKDIKIHIMTEEHNFEAFCSYGLETDISINLIKSPHSNSKVLQNSKTSEASYEVYGTNRFAQINVLKWTLILEVLKVIDKNDIVVFSDFDVIWFKEPETSLWKLRPSTIFAQSEWQKVNDVKFCSGIIGLVKSKENETIFADLLAFHQLRLKALNGNYFDQQAFNDFFSDPKLQKRVKKLSPESFVIGAEIPKYLLRSRRNIYAIHANYLKGQKRKLVVMQALTLYLNAPKSRIVAALLTQTLLTEGRFTVILDRCLERARIKFQTRAR